MTINVACTRYDVVRKVAHKVCQMVIVNKDEDADGAIVKGQRGQKLSKVFDLTWHDLGVNTEFLAKLKLY